MSLLHVVNGDSTLQTLRDTGIEGEMHSWFDMLMEGPAPDASDESWQRRTNELAALYGLDPAEFLTNHRTWMDRLAHAGDYDEIVLWFEGDLFCTVNLAFLFDWFASHQPRPATLSLVCPLDDFLGTFPAPKLSLAFAARQPVSEQLLDEGACVWRALASGSLSERRHSGPAEEPQHAEDLLANRRRAEYRLRLQACPPPAHPALARALRLQQDRLPREPHGVSRVDAHLLGLLANEPAKLGPLFKAFYATDLGRHLGMGDHQFAVLAVELHRRGLVAINPPPGPPPYERFGGWQLAITPNGREAL